jgi:tryptophan halogenase
MKFIIVGGGTAGWISAFKIKMKVPNSQVTVIESSQIPIIGVGEGVTGQFTDILNDPALGLDEFEFLQKTWALPKHGILFSGWNKDTSKEFYSPIEGSVTEAVPYDVFVYNSLLNNDNVAYSSVSGFYYEEKKVPWFVKDGQLHFLGGRAYHIDAYKVGEFFKEKAVSAGVIHIDAKITDVHVENNKIKSIVLDNQSELTSDMFIDCSGFSKILMSKLDNEWIDRSQHLPVNNAVIFKPTNYPDTKTPYTSAKAKKNGWIFEIPTRYKTGRGYIYCDKFASEEDIIDEIKEEYGEIEIVNKISFSAGTYKNSWVSNCVVLGLASGFLEPLQATSLHITLCQLEKLVRDVFCIDNVDISDKFIQDDFNSYGSMLTSDMLDFVQVTYTGGREDTEFWKFMTNSAKKTEEVEKIIHLAKTRLLRLQDFRSYDGYAGQALWIYSLAGLGHFDKTVIRKVLTAANFDLESINFDYQVFKEQMKTSMSNKLTCDQLNDILLKGEELQLSLNKIY